MIVSFLSMGIPAIDNQLSNLISQLRLVSIGSLAPLYMWARVIGLIAAMCVCSYECWMMMLGKRAINVLKLLRILGLSMCIGLSPYICSAVETPGLALEKNLRKAAQSRNFDLAMKEKMVADLQDKYYKKLRALQDSISHANRIAEIGENAGAFDKVVYVATHINEQIESLAKRAALVTETKITEYVNLFIRFLGECILQIALYSILIMQVAFMKLLALFCPIAFALSLAPPWSNSWSQWVSKYASLSLWGFAAYFCLLYVHAILMYTLEIDIKAYTTLLYGKIGGSWEEIGTLGMQGIGSTCFYFVGMVVGAMLIKSVPEVCGWLIPGGVSSSSGGAAAGAAVGGAVGGVMGAASVGGAGAIATGKGVSVGAGYAGSAAKGAVVGAGASLATNPSGFGMPQGAIEGAILSTKVHHAKRQDKKDKKNK